MVRLRAMRSSMSMMVLAGCLALAACAPAGPSGTVNAKAPVAPTDVDAAVRSRIEQYRQGYEVRSLEALAPLYAHDEALTVTVQGRTSRGWLAVQMRLGEFLAAAVSVKVRVSELQVQPLGEAGAAASMNVHRTYGDGVKTVDEQGTLLLVFRRQGEDWVIVAEQFGWAPPGA